ncbi:hypothetical protein BH24ACT5_BH24ACT5_11150 [soil metagenome]
MPRTPDPGSGTIHRCRYTELRLEPSEGTSFPLRTMRVERGRARDGEQSAALAISEFTSSKELTELLPLVAGAEAAWVSVQEHDRRLDRIRFIVLQREDRRGPIPRVHGRQSVMELLGLLPSITVDLEPPVHFRSGALNLLGLQPNLDGPPGSTFAVTHVATVVVHPKRRLQGADRRPPTFNGTMRRLVCCASFVTYQSLWPKDPATTTFSRRLSA